MGRFYPGDILLARIRLKESGNLKTRPVLVIGSSHEGLLTVCPVSSSAPSDAPFIGLAPCDFLEGGLDICDESYVLVAMSFLIRPGEVIGKKGRVAAEVIASVHELRKACYGLERP